MVQNQISAFRVSSIKIQYLAVAIIFLLLSLVLAIPRNATAAATVEMTYASKFGSSGSGDGQMSYPRGITMSPDNSKIYVADTSNNRIQAFNASDYSFIAQTGSAGSGDGQFNNINGMTVSYDGTRLYVADTGNHRIQIFNTSNLSFVAKFGTVGSSPGQLFSPKDVALSPDGTRLFVANYEQVSVFNSSNFSYIDRWGDLGDEQNEFNQINSVVVSPDASRIYVADGINDRIQVFNGSTYEYISEFGVQGGGGPGTFSQPGGLSLSPNGNRIYVTDSENHQIQIYSSSDYSFIEKAGGNGSSDGQFYNPRDSILANDESFILVADTENHRVQKMAIQVSGEEEEPDGEGSENEIPADANNDGIADSEQANVRAFTSSVSDKTVVLEVDESCSINDALVKAEKLHQVQDPGFDYPEGLINFNVSCGEIGYTTTVKQYYYNTDPGSLALRKYNPNSQTYFGIEGATVEAITLGGNTSTLASYQVADGGELDMDGQADGIIIDPAGLAEATVGAPNTGLGRQ